MHQRSIVRQITIRRHRKTKREKKRRKNAAVKNVVDRLAPDIPSPRGVTTAIVEAPAEYDLPHTRQEYGIAGDSHSHTELTGGATRQRMYRRLRDDPLARLHSHRQIDEAQYQAGRRYQHDFEAAQISIAAINPAREPVDGGAMTDPINDRRLRALKSIAAADARLGVRATRLMQMFLLHRHTIRMIACAFGVSSRSHVEHIGWEIHRALDELAWHYGFATEKK